METFLIRDDFHYRQAGAIEKGIREFEFDVVLRDIEETIHDYGCLNVGFKWACHYLVYPNAEDQIVREMWDWVATQCRTTSLDMRSAIYINVLELIMEEEHPMFMPLVYGLLADASTRWPFVEFYDSNRKVFFCHFEKYALPN